MCACEPSFICSRCAGTWLADDYPELPDGSEREPRESATHREAYHAD